MALRATQWNEDAGAAGGVDTVVTTARRIRLLTVVSTKTVLPSARASAARLLRLQRSGTPIRNPTAPACSRPLNLASVSRATARQPVNRLSAKHDH